MLIFLGVQTAVDVNHLLPSMLIFSLLVTGPGSWTLNEDGNNLLLKASKMIVLPSVFPVENG
jgi:hypothetical protein